MNELVSIIMPSYNSAKYISEAIESVIAQTYTNWELLITDDCSTDNSRDIIKQYAETDSRVKLFCLNENSGAGVARNNSIKEAKGKYIAFLDSDDRWMPEKLKRQISLMEEKQCLLSYTSYMTIDDNGKSIGIVLAPNRHTFTQNKCDDKIGFSTAIYNQKQLGKIFMPTIRKRQDWALIMTILRVCKVSYGIKQPMAFYRKNHNSLSKNKVSLIKYNIAVYKKILGWNTIRAYLFFLVVFMPHYISKKIFNIMISRY